MNDKEARELAHEISRRQWNSTFAGISCVANNYGGYAYMDVAKNAMIENLKNAMEYANIGRK